jgi:glycosyltransferase involved in cell wall biosynthesis
MNFLLVVPFDEERGGVVSVAENLAKYLQAHGHTVLFLHPGPAVLLKTRITKQGFQGIELRLGFPFAPPRRLISAMAFPFLFPVVLLQLLWFLRRRRIHVVNLHYPVDRFFYLAICKSLLRFRLVTSIHGDDAFVIDRGPSKPKKRYSRAFRLLIASSDLVVLPSDVYRQRLVEVFPQVRDRTISIYNCVDPAQFTPADSEPGWRHDPYILCVAALADYKGIDVLLHAAKPLLVDDPSLRLVLAGEGPRRMELEGLAASLGIRKQTQFVGHRSGAEVAQLLQGCEVFVLPSREEPFGIVLIEAMACRKPIVATAVGGIPEIVEHQKSGILVEPDNPAALTEGIRRVLRSSELRKTIADNGHSRVMERFCLVHNGTSYEKAFIALYESPSEQTVTT